MRLILASASPRRRELLAALITDFDVIPSDLPEEMTGDPTAEAMRLAEAKALAVADSAPGAVVIGSDTVVHDGKRFFDKPRDPADAVALLRDLRGRAHTVTTGVSVVCEGRCVTAASEAGVSLRALTDDEIDAYVASGRPLDKAGAYAIQDDDIPTVDHLDGCY
ncbi:MAG: Maf family protein, partial [Dehalococcoidia bacterium]|nr:Maf family protein [Dehalococcoidia bacterium]